VYNRSYNNIITYLLLLTTYYLLLSPHGVCVFILWPCEGRKYPGSSHASASYRFKKYFGKIASVDGNYISRGSKAAEGSAPAALRVGRTDEEGSVGPTRRSWSDRWTRVGKTDVDSSVRPMRACR